MTNRPKIELQGDDLDDYQLTVGVANSTDVPPKVIIPSAEGSQIDFDHSLLGARILSLIETKTGLNSPEN